MILLTTFDNSSVAAIVTEFPFTVTVDEDDEVVSVDETEVPAVLAVVAAVVEASSAAHLYNFNATVSVGRIPAPFAFATNCRLPSASTPAVKAKSDLALILVARL